MYPVYVPYYLSGILIMLVLFKSILFIGSTSKPNLSSWFFFTTNAVYNSRNVRSRKLKVIQNRFTLAIAIVAVVDVLAIIIFH